MNKVVKVLRGEGVFGVGSFRTPFLLSPLERETSSIDHDNGKAGARGPGKEEGEGAGGRGRGRNF